MAPAVQTSYVERIPAGLAGMSATEHGWDADTKICETAAGIGFGLAVSQSPTTDVQATGTLTISSTNNAVDAETVTIGGKVYTFKTTLTDVDGNVLIGADKAASLANLSAAINLGAGAGTLYAASTTIHPTVRGNGASPLVVTANVPGAGGNAIATTETMTNGSWGAATLASGVTGPAATAHPKAVVLGGTAFAGVSIRDVTLAVSQGDKYILNQNMGVLVRGDIWVLVSAAVNVGDAVKYNATTGMFGDSGGTAVSNARYLTSGGVGALVILRVNHP